jgi:hypothetical protein
LEATVDFDFPDSAGAGVNTLHNHGFGGFQYQQRTLHGTIEFPHTVLQQEGSGHTRSSPFDRSGGVGGGLGSRNAGVSSGNDTLTANEAVVLELSEDDAEQSDDDLYAYASTLHLDPGKRISYGPYV